VGERRSSQRGEGIEFEEHRRYQSGDDMRRIDPHLYARFGAPFVREYNVGRQLTVTILLDASRSMAAGAPAKFDVARDIATGLALVALTSLDAVQSGVWCNDRLEWRPRSSGRARLDDLERWWATFTPNGSSDVLAAVRRLEPELPRRGLAVVISDLWSESARSAIDALAAAEQSVLVIQTLAAEELDPARYGLDAITMIDSESGEEVDVTLSPDRLTRYSQLLDGWTEVHRQRSLASRGSLARVTNEQTIDDVFLRVLPAIGVVR
jgi:uncharacterized protein (DUF58 family)